MFCTQCGQPLPSDARFCPHCGTPVAETPDRDDVEEATGVIETGEVDLAATLDEVPVLAPGTALLVVVRGPNAGSRYLLDRDQTTIGRHPESDVFLDDVTVSRHHARVDRDEAGFVLNDLGSLNGTYLAGERVDRQLLKAGNEVQVGRYKLLFVDSSA